MSSSGPKLARNVAGTLPFDVPSVLRVQAMLLAIAAVGVLPFVVWGTFLGHDFAFFISSCIEVSRQIHHGNLWPRLAVGANFGAGQPRFIFYPPLSWLGGGVLQWLLPARIVPGTFALLTLWLGGNSMVRLARQWLPFHQAITAALLYVLNPYFLYCLYTRTAFAELLAGSLFPLAVLWLIRLFDQGGFTATRNFAIVFALIWLADVPAAIVTSYALLSIAAVEAWRNRAVRPLVSFAGASLLAAALAAFYMVPVLWERTWIDSVAAVSWAAEFSASHLLTLIGGRLHIGEPMGKLLAIALIEVCAGAVVLGSFGRRSLGRLWLPTLVSLVVSALAVLSPWQFFWSKLPAMMYVQFSWRWLLVLAVPLSFAGAILFAKLPDWAHPRIAFMVVIALLSLAHTAHYPHYGFQFAQRLQADTESGRGYGGTFGYAPAGHTGDNTQREPVRLLSGDAVSVEHWQEEYKAVRIATVAPSKAIFRVSYFPAWRAKVNGREVPVVENSATGLAQIDIPAGVSDVELRFTRTPDRTIGSIMSLIALAGALAWPRLART